MKLSKSSIVKNNTG